MKLVRLALREPGLPKRYFRGKECPPLQKVAVVMGAASAALRCAGASLTEAYYGVCGGVCGPSEIRSVKSMRLEALSIFVSGIAVASEYP